MRAVIADTGPLHYLTLIWHIKILSALSERMIIPAVARDELARSETPETVRTWIRSAPAWLLVHSPRDAIFPMKHRGVLTREKRRLWLLAASLTANLLLMDDREGVRAARYAGFRVIGTLRVLDLAARLELFDLADAFERIKRTNFRYRQEIMDELLNSQASKSAESG